MSQRRVYQTSVVCNASEQTKHTSALAHHRQLHVLQGGHRRDHAGHLKAARKASARPCFRAQFTDVPTVETDRARVRRDLSGNLLDQRQLSWLRESGVSSEDDSVATVAASLMGAL